MRRRLPRPSELAPLLKFERPGFGVRHRLERAHTIDDLRLLARRRTPKAPFDYADGGAEDELTIQRARDDFHAVEFRPGVLRDVSTISTSRDVLGVPTALPFGIAPTGFTRMMRAEGELAGVAAASRARIPFALSTMGTASIEAVAEAAASAPSPGRAWFQLYLWKDRERSRALIQRAADAGMDSLIMTVDVPVGGRRLRDKRNGMTVPPTLTPRTVLQTLPHPGWWIDFLTTEPLTFSSLGESTGQIKTLFESMFDPSTTIADLEWVREQWPGNIIVKGVQSAADAVRIAETGVDAIVVSNHGGRQLDRAPVPFAILGEIRDALDRLERRPELWMDSGITSGADIVASLAIGARFTLVGRAYLYGLMAGGEAGVDRAIDILRQQIEGTMTLLGVSHLDELTPDHVRDVRHRLVDKY